MEANWAMFGLLAALTGVGVYIGHAWFKRWFNPLSLYSAIWGFNLCNYELNLIQYYPISGGAWIYIVLAWVSLYLGSATVLLMSPSRTPSVAPVLAVDLDWVKKAVFALSAVGSLGLLSQIRAVTHEFGNPFVALIANAGDIYGIRTSESFGLSYVGAFLFIACGLAGVYAARIGKVTSVTLVPISLTALQLVTVMGRGGLAIALTLFLVSYLHTPKAAQVRYRKGRIIGIGLLVTLFAGVFVFVSSVRNLEVDFPGTTPAMEKISEYIPFFASVYSNFSTNPVAFSQYLASSEDQKTGFWGMYTFAPVFRLLSKFGFMTAVPAHEENYYTPVPVNTGTYLKNLHSDFGLSGIIFFPYLLGATTTLLVLRASEMPRLLEIVVLGNLYVLVLLSFVFDFMLLGDWYISTVGGVLVSLAIEARRSNRSRCVALQLHGTE